MKRLVLSLLFCAAPAWAGVSKGQKAPEFTLPALAGGMRSLSSLKGKVVVLDFWAQWCEPCKKELPELQKLSRAYADKDVLFVGINLDKQRSNAERLARQFGLTFEVLLDPVGSVASIYDLPKMPTSFVIDKKGIVRHINEGFDGPKDVDRFKLQLDELIR